VKVPPDVKEAAAKVLAARDTDDDLRALGGPLLWSTAEAFYALLDAGEVLATWVKARAEADA
jgi:hypothetical protein